MERRLPCDGEAGPPRCVEITLRSAPEPKALPVLIEAMTRRLLAQAAPGTELPEGVSFKEAEMVDEVRLVTDAATLQPRLVSWVRTVRVVTSVGKRGPLRTAPVGKNSNPHFSSDKMPSGS